MITLKIHVSVIIPAYNAAEFISDTIQSVLAQSYQQFEIVVVDDGSTDLTASIVKRYQAKNEGKIRYVFQENGGVSVARNTGIHYAKGSLIAFCDADDLWSVNHLEVLTQVFKEDHSLGLVHSNIMKIDIFGIEKGVPVREPSLLSGYIYDAIFLRQADIATSSVIFQKKCIEQIGNFDIYLSFLGCEDRDFWLRLTRKYPVKYVDQVLTFYRVRNNSLSRNQSKMLKARLYVIDKYTSENRKDQQLKKSALARVYRDLGDQALMQHDFVCARNHYQKSLGYKIWNRWAWINLIKAFFKINVRYMH
ncbi:glycosyl transferase [Desulfomarina profundi]|uniref:Glycosyl transferase n=1 Tax=Desulfomarina profundi TaxID=2772557 RepID=A0A8D5JMU8_9BACT|nr:glycosyltransferase family A protein [Desulfomarina profundi]BCL59420.1 glycosyl transferase [Desulfomarina profundi]